jgi:3-hydroxypropionyl-CoA synthetase (ADP-forming)
MMGVQAYKSLSEIPHPPEVVIVAVGLDQVPSILDECASRGIHNVIIISGGGKELGAEGRELEEDIRERARGRDIRVIGCNCIGVFDGESRFDSFFQTHDRMARAKPGAIALLTQSGTVGAAFMELVGDLGISRFVSYGNRIDVDEADMLCFLESDPKTRVIACYVEGFRDGRKFVAAAQRVSAKKPVVIYKSGRSAKAATASISHTGFFGGTYAVAKGAFRQARLVAVDSFDDFVAVSKALAMQPQAMGNRVAMVGNGAGTMVQAIDLFDQYPLELVELSQDSLQRLRAKYPAYYLVGNPLDITGSATSEDYEKGIESLVDDPGVDVIMLWIVFQDTPLEEDIVDRLERLSRSRRKPIVVGAIGGPYTLKMSRAIEKVGVPVYQSVSQWVAAAWGLSQP